MFISWPIGVYEFVKHVPSWNALLAANKNNTKSVRKKTIQG